MIKMKYHLIGNENVTYIKRKMTVKLLKIVFSCVLTITILIFTIRKSVPINEQMEFNANIAQNDMQVLTNRTNNNMRNQNNTHTLPTAELDELNTETAVNTTIAQTESTFTENSVTNAYNNNWIDAATENLDFHSSVMNATFAANSTQMQKTVPVKSQLKSLKYFVFTPDCHIPYVDPFMSDAMKIFKPQKYKKCSRSADLVTSKFDKNQRRYTLHLNGNKMTIQCCYQDIVRFGKYDLADDDYIALPCSNFHQDFLVPEHIEAMIVKCKDRKTNELLQKSAFSFIQRKDEMPSNKSIPTTRRPSVLMIGIDSLSRINFRRNMPLTHKYLSDKHWFELEAYNKVGDNTFPNFMALLTGFNESIAIQVCNPNLVSGLNKCRFAWNYYKAQGYRTAFAEDWVKYATFNYLKKGFHRPPTDYYLRPFTLAMEHMLNVKKEAGIPFCLGQRHYAEYIYDYALQLTNFYQNETEPVFGFFWTNSFSHNDFSKSSGMDTRMLEYFRTMEQNDVFERSIVIFFSDHGVRWGPLRRLSSGFLEERLPMFFISLPKWFQAAHPDFVAALNVNKNRLTSPFDIYKTLNHILESGNPELSLPPPASCANCQSIFKEVPVRRTCADAGISEHWCTCGRFESITVKNNTLVKSVSQMIIDEMNRYIRIREFDDICATFTLKSIIDAEHKLMLNNDHHVIYRIMYETNPKSASFEATVSYDTRTKSIGLDVETISRLNMYISDSFCVKDKQAKKYCICKK